MNLCVIGNSHVGALKLGWNRLNSGREDVEITFFGSPAEGFRAISVSGNEIVPTHHRLAENIRYTSGGHSSVRIDDYQAFLVYGLSFRLPQIDARTSRAVAKAVCYDSYTASLNFFLAKTVRTLTSSPIYVSPDPLPARTGSNGPELKDCEAVTALLNDVFKDERFTFVIQPRETVENGWATRAIYSKGSTRLELSEKHKDLKHPEADARHMNAEFGEIYLRALIPLLTA